MTKKTMSGTCRTDAGWRRIAAWGAAAAMLAGCGARDDGAGEDYVGPAAGAVGGVEQLNAAVSAILADYSDRTRESIHTISSIDGATVEVPARVALEIPPAPLPPVEPIAPAGLRVEPFGSIMAEMDMPPLALAMLDSGEAIFSTAAGIELRSADGATRTLSTLPAATLLLDATGERLLAQSEDRVVVHSGPGLAEAQPLSSHPPGYAHWALEPGHLLFVRERVQYSASAKDRIDLDIYLYDIAGGREREAPWAPFGRYAALGTLPALRILWGTFPQPYKVDPVPARLYRLDNGTPTGPLTGASPAADIQPSAGSNGHLLWIRTWRRGSPTGRAMWRLVAAGDTPELQLTDTPTWLVATSPSGIWGATVTTEDGAAVLRRFAMEDVPSQASAAAQRTASQAAEIDRAMALQNDLEEALARLPLGGTLIDGSPTPQLDRVPAAADIAAMAAAMRTALAQRYQIADADPLTLLCRVDALMEEVSPYMTEHPAMLLALGGAMAEALPPNRGWSLEGAGKALSQDVAGETWRRTLELTMAMPFGAARERLASGLSLSRTVAEIAARGKAPLHLVENLRGDTAALLMPREWTAAGLPMQFGDLALLREAMERQDPTNDALNVAAHSIALDQGSAELALWSALRLARNNPTSAEALTMLAETLKDAFYTREAADVFEAAALVDPGDPYPRLQRGDSMLALGDFDAARADFALARRIDIAGTYSEQLDQRDLLVEALEKEEQEAAGK